MPLFGGLLFLFTMAYAEEIKRSQVVVRRIKIDGQIQTLDLSSNPKIKKVGTPEECLEIKFKDPELPIAERTRFLKNGMVIQGQQLQLCVDSRFTDRRVLTPSEGAFYYLVDVLADFRTTQSNLKIVEKVKEDAASKEGVELKSGQSSIQPYIFAQNDRHEQSNVTGSPCSGMQMGLGLNFAVSTNWFGHQFQLSNQSSIQLSGDLNKVWSTAFNIPIVQAYPQSGSLTLGVGFFGFGMFGSGLYGFSSAVGPRVFALYPYSRGDRSIQIYYDLLSGRGFNIRSARAGLSIQHSFSESPQSWFLNLFFQSIYYPADASQGDVSYRYLGYGIGIGKGF